MVSYGCSLQVRRRPPQRLLAASALVLAAAAASRLLALTDQAAAAFPGHRCRTAGSIPQSLRLRDVRHDRQAGRRESLVLVANAAPASAIAALFLLAFAPPAVAFVPEPEVLAQAVVDAKLALQLLSDEPSETVQVEISRLLRRSVAPVGEAAAAAYARKRGPTLNMMLQRIQGQDPRQTLSPIDVDRLSTIEALCEEVLSIGDSLVGVGKGRARQSIRKVPAVSEQSRMRAKEILQQLLCELDCVAERTADGGWAGCRIDATIPDCRGIVGVNDPRARSAY